MINNLNNWAKKVADAWKEGCPEIVEILLKDENFIFPFMPAATKRLYDSGGITAERATEIEQISIDVFI
jgi:hypothetical protein